MIILKNTGNILENNGKVLTDGGVLGPVKGFYYGIITSETRPLPHEINFALLTEDTEEYVETRVSVSFPQEIGFPVLAVPYFAETRESWFVKTNDRGEISGTPEDEKTKLFPNMGIAIYNGILYKVYVGNYHTRFLDPVSFRDY